MSDPNFYERVGSARPDRSLGDEQSGSLGDPPRPPSVPASGRPLPTELGVSRWAAGGGDLFYGVGETRAELPAGLYRCVIADMIGPALRSQRVETDNLIELPDDASASIIAEFATFWAIGDKFRARGFLHKRGFLLWGPPGSGKTSTVQLLIKRLITELDGVVLLLDQPSVTACCLQMVRKIEPKRPVIAIMEDMDALVRKFGESEYLALLDGEAQVDNIVFLATTNYPEFLDKRLTDRPSRFDTIRYIGMPSPAARRLYLSTKEPSLEEDEREAWVHASDGLSVAHLKEMIVAIKCFGQSLEQVTARFEQMRIKPSSEDSPERKPGGFLSGMRLGNGAHP